MESLQDRGGCLASPLARVGFGIGMLAVVLVLVFVIQALGDDDDTEAEGDASTSIDDATDDVAEDATTDSAAESDATDDEPVDPRAESGRRTITLADGQLLDLDLFIAPTSEMTIIAAPSRNADLTSITPVGESLVSGDCANIIAFDAQSVDASPISLYQALFEMLMAGEFGPIFGDGYGTLGASFTSLPSWQAARDNGADYNFVFAPSDPFPDDFSSDDVPMSFLFVGEGDSAFLPVFENWRDHGFNGATVPGSEHGSALFTGENDDVVLSRIERGLCF